MRRLIVGALMCASAGALAQGTDEQRAACQPDAEKYCQQVGTETAKIGQCLGRNFRNLSPACRQVLKFATVQRVCAQQIGAGCEGVGGSSAAVVQCLSRSSRLPPNCRNAIRAYGR